ncbi:MAG: sigma-54 dependent transcriptional regulator [Nitrospirota bacterium]|nr:sigma-54 dependent transcriptional regulator [Nitrospirota bacterium]
MAAGSILLVEDEKAQREIVSTILSGEGYEVIALPNLKEGVRALREGTYDTVLTDLKLPDGDGIELLRVVVKERPALSVVIMTAHGTVNTAVEAMKLGAFDYLTKPLERDDLLLVTKNAVDKTRLLRENRRLKEQLGQQFSIDNIIASDGRMQEVLKIVRKVAGSGSTVLVYGESGTGKELIAKAIHQNSPRKDKPFVAINCAAIPETLLESELFGHEKGAFTGASTRKAGLFEAAEGGTLFLDEVGDMGMSLQAKLLRVLQEKEIRRVGGKETLKIDVRILAATNKKLDEEIKKGTFREDLYYRLNIIAIQLPPLRERKGDIPRLVGHFMEKHGRLHGKAMRGMSDEALNLLVHYSWPGNVRQLEGVVERAILFADGDILDGEALPLELHMKAGSAGKVDLELPSEGVSFEEVEREMLLKAMKKADWVIAKAAPLLGMSYRTLQYRLNKFGIKREEP